ncbi:hypothetical protein GCM10010336_63110 [Streptomyces goshikiensis]|nr:hypothetical protein GCM10010336_63110 [Streptomyces goshikiensis]
MAHARLATGCLHPREGWRTLRALAQTDSRLHADDLDVLLDCGERQSNTLEEVRSAAAARTLGCAPQAAR